MQQRPVQSTRPLSPIRIRAIETALRAELDAAPTQITDAISPLVSRALAPVQPMLRLPREQGYPYLMVVNPYEVTSALVNAAIERYVSIEGTYPECIYLSAFRYLTYGQGWKFYYSASGVRIPFEYGGTPFHDAKFHATSYDVLLRGGLYS